MGLAALTSLSQHASDRQAVIGLVGDTAALNPQQIQQLSLLKKNAECRLRMQLVGDSDRH